MLRLDGAGPGLPVGGAMIWPWLALVGLGAFHGANPAMGWLFAVALGLHRGSRAMVFQSLVPIAVGHALAIGLVAFTVSMVGRALDPQVMQVAAGVLLIGWAGYHSFYGARHRVRVGMRTGMAGLAVWSFLMASAHGAGLMLTPVLIPLGSGGAAPHHATAGASLVISLAAVAVHTLAMIAVTGLIAVVVYEWIGLAFLRRGWINLDRLWTASLVATGAILILMVPLGHH